jgi:hypothetical protein
MKANKTEDGQYQTTGEEKTRNHRVALIHLHIIKPLNNKKTYLSILTLNVNKLNFPIKRHLLANWIKKEYPTICCLQEMHLIVRNKHWLRVKGWKKIYKVNCPPKQAGVAIVMSDKVHFKLALVK